MAIQVTRTYVGSIQNHRQVCDGLDSLGDSASKIWNVARWTADRVWDEIGKIPDEGSLKSYMKNQSCWKDLNAQSSQKVIEELSDAFQSWFDLRHKEDKVNPARLPQTRRHPTAFHGHVQNGRLQTRPREQPSPTQQGEEPQRILVGFPAL